MKFEIKHKIYHDGDQRDVLKFALIPTTVKHPPTKKTYVIWLDKYHAKQVFCHFKHNNHSRWLTIEKWIA
jgi:hypothetical protein